MSETENVPASEPSTAEPSASIVDVRGIGIIIIHVSDLDRSVAFYKNTLGFRDGEQMLQPGVTLEAGDATIYLTASRELEERRPTATPGISISLILRGVREAFGKLRDAGVRIVDEYEEASEYFASFAIADPDGNVIELWGRP